MRIHKNTINSIGFLDEESIWTNVESGYAPVPQFQQLLHLERYFPESALNAILSPFLSTVYFRLTMYLYYYYIFI